MTKTHMTQKCLKCGAPISGFLGMVAWFAGVKPSQTKSGYCNKCEASVDEGLGDEVTGEPVTKNDVVSPVVPEQAPVAPVPPVVPVAPEVKDMFEDLEKK